MKIAPNNDVWLPSPSDAVDYISEIESQDFARIDYDELKALTVRHFPTLPFPIGVFAPTMLLYRARLNAYARPYLHQDELGPPPSEVLTGFGRANKPFQRVFYASTLSGLALVEVCPRNNAFVDAQAGFATIGIWSSAPHSLRLVNIYAAREAQKRRPDLCEVDQFFEHIFQPSEFDFNRSVPDARATTRLVLDHIADIYARPCEEGNPLYKLSVAYTERILSGDTEGAVDGIRYPSVAAHFAGDNVVLRWSSYNDKIFLAGATFVSYVHVRSTQRIASQILATATVADTGHLQWS